MKRFTLIPVSGTGQAGLALMELWRKARRFQFSLLATMVCLVPAWGRGQEGLRFSANTNAEPALSALPDGGGLLPPDWTLGVAAGSGFGVNAMGSNRAHDLALGTVHIGKVLVAPELGELSRHLELGGEFFSGAQYRPARAYVVGATPLLRYRLWPMARWTPFVDGGAGVAATDIGRPDLSTTFEFCPQAGVGVQWKWRRDLALTFEARYLHLSNAGIDSPNDGVNTLVFSGGVAWFF